MILDEMSRWRPRPGAIVMFGPSGRSLTAAAAAPADSAPASFLQADHLRAYAERRGQAGEHRAWTGVATDVDGPLDREALARAVTRLVVTHEGLRSWFDVSGAEPVRHVVPADDVELVVTDEIVLGGKTLDGDVLAGDDWQAALQRHLVSVFDATCRPDSWPAFCLGAVERPDGFGLFWGCDHAFTDGASQIMVASELADLYAAEIAAPGGPEVVEGALPGPDQTGPFADFAMSEHVAAATYDASSPEVREWTRLIEGSGGRLPSFPLDLGLEPGQTAPVSISSNDLLDADGAASLDARCREAGARTVDAVFAAIAATEHELAHRDSYVGVTVLGARERGPFARSHGWFCTFAPIAFDVACHEGDVDGLLRSAHEAMARGKQIGRMPVHVALAEMVRSGVVRPETLGSPQLVSYLDLRRFPGAGRPAHERGVHFTGAGRTANASMWVNRDSRRLYLAMQHPDTPQAHESTDLYRRTVARTLQAMADGATRVPRSATAHAGHSG
ncbi:condensation domain-containing protein [Aeromicrobium fastidiosum]